MPEVYYKHRFQIEFAALVSDRNFHRTVVDALLISSNEFVGEKKYNALVDRLLPVICCSDSEFRKSLTRLNADREASSLVVPFASIEYARRLRRLSYRGGPLSAYDVIARPLPSILIKSHLCIMCPPFPHHRTDWADAWIIVHEK